MHRQDPRSVPILERIARWVPGYGGYLERGSRRSDDERLREAVARRLAEVKRGIEAAVREAVDRGGLAEIGGLDRIARKVDSLSDRIRHAGAGSDAFYSGPAMNARWAESLHGSDMALFDQVDAIVATATASSMHSDGIKALDAALSNLEAALDRRANALQGIQ